MWHLLLEFHLFPTSSVQIVHHHWLFHYLEQKITSLKILLLYQRGFRNKNSKTCTEKAVLWLFWQALL